MGNNLSNQKNMKKITTILVLGIVLNGLNLQ